MLIGIVFMLYTLVIVLSVIVGLTKISNVPFIVFCLILQWATWVLLGLIAIGIL